MTCYKGFLLSALVCLGAIALGTSPGVGQTSSTAAVTITASLTGTIADIYLIDDFDLLDAGNLPVQFQVTLTNNGPALDNVKLRLEVRSVEFGVLAQGTTGSFALAGIGSIDNPLQLTNDQLFNSSSTYYIQDFSVDNAADDLLDAVLATGSLPTGEYEVVFTLLNGATGQEFQPLNPEPGAPDDVIEDSFPISVNNVTTIYLVGPGVLAVGPASELPEIFTTQPLLQWESNASSFMLRVCKQETPDQTPEQVMLNEPRLEAMLENVFSFQYPETGVWPLEENGVYYWQVTVLLQTTSGPAEVTSDIFGFRIASTSGGGAASIEQTQIGNMLSLLLGYDVYSGLFSSGGALEGFMFTGDVMLDGQAISLEDLQQLLNELQQTGVEILAVEPEQY